MNNNPRLIVKEWNEFTIIVDLNCLNKFQSIYDYLD